jgi:hypothetical protein
MSHAKDAKPPRRRQSKNQTELEPSGQKRKTTSWRLGVLGVRKISPRLDSVRNQLI